MTSEVYDRAFDSEFFVEHAGEIQNAALLAKAVADMDHATHNGTPWEVRLAWLQFYDIAGPIITGKFIASGAWRDYCPDIHIETDTDTIATLWTNGLDSVVARAKFWHEIPCDMTFTVE